MAGTLQSLVELAEEKSSEKRRELLRSVTDLFFETEQDARPEPELEHFDVILSSVTREMAVEVRQELAQRFATAPGAPREFIRQLANDEPSVARDVLQKSLALGDEDLIDIARSRGQEHLRAISMRDEVSEAVSGVVAARGDDETLAMLASNDGAALSRQTMELMVDRAGTSPVLHAPLVNRSNFAPDLLNEMYDFVRDTLKKKILERNEQLTEDELERALANSRARTRAAAGPPPDYAEAAERVRKAKLRRGLDANFLAGRIRESDSTAFLLGFAELADIDYSAAKAAYDNPSDEPLALICKAAGLDRAFFVTISILRAGEGGPDLSAADRLSQIYESTPKQAAERVMRFWKLRKQAAESGSQAA